MKNAIYPYLSSTLSKEVIGKNTLKRNFKQRVDEPYWCILGLVPEHREHKNPQKLSWLFSQYPKDPKLSLRNSSNIQF